MSEQKIDSKKSLENSTISSVVETVVRHVELGKPWECECGEEHELGTYVVAHWDVKLIHTCDCKRKHSLQSGCLRLLGA